MLEVEPPVGVGCVEAYAIKIPPSWPSDPQVWFVQVEAQFAVRGIIAQCMMYHHIVGTLSGDCDGDQRPAAVTTRGQLVRHPQSEVNRTHCCLRTTPIAAVVHGRRGGEPETHAVAALNAATAW